MACPLCREKSYFVGRRYDLNCLSEQWLCQFGFNPFQNIELGNVIEKHVCITCGLHYFSPDYYGDGDFYSKLSRHDWYYEAEKWEFDRALELVKEFRPKRILEIGCGSGAFLQKILPAVEYSLGIDINQSALSLARKNGLNVSDKKLNELEDSFDMIFLFEVLEHIESPMEILKWVSEKLNPGGVLIIAVPNPESYLKDIDIVLLDMPPHHNTSWGRCTFDYLSIMLGMQLVSYETEPLKYVHYQGYLYSLISNRSNNKLIQKIQKVIAKLFEPFLYEYSKNKILGQTHLVALKKESS